MSNCRPIASSHLGPLVPNLNPIDQRSGITVGIDRPRSIDHVDPAVHLHSKKSQSLITLELLLTLNNKETRETSGYGQDNRKGWVGWGG